MESKLIKALIIAVNALENDIISYDWINQNSCNCGVVVQAIKNFNPEEVKDLFNLAVSQAKIKREDGLTWKFVCNNSCNITDIPTTVVFKELHNLGLTRKDIVHLEFMNNSAILKESGIKTFWRPKYYKKKSNLILYLKAWIRILENNSKRDSFSNKNKLEADFLIASAFGKIEEMESIRKQLILI